jgi:predicted transcriptional regulator
MTIKEVAELCGVTEQTVLNWTHKVADDLPKNLEGLSVKLEEARKSGKDPADFTLDETLAIIGEGGKNKALASLLAENAVNKNALAVQSEAMAKITKLAEKLPELMEWYEKTKNLPEQLEKFKGYAVAAYKKLAVRQDEVEARVDGAYKEVLNNATSNATGEVIEYLLSSHKPSAHEAQLANLKKYLSLTIAATGDKRDKTDLFRLYPGYEAQTANPIPKDAFAAHLLLLYPQIGFKGGVFSGVRFDY